MCACVPGSGAAGGRCSEPACPMANDLYEQPGSTGMGQTVQRVRERAVSSALPVVMRY